MNNNAYVQINLMRGEAGWSFSKTSPWGFSDFVLTLCIIAPHCDSSRIQLPIIHREAVHIWHRHCFAAFFIQIALAAGVVVPECVTSHVLDTP